MLSEPTGQKKPKFFCPGLLRALLAETKQICLSALALSGEKSKEAQGSRFGRERSRKRNGVCSNEHESIESASAYSGCEEWCLCDWLGQTKLVRSSTIRNG